MVYKIVGLPVAAYTVFCGASTLKYPLPTNPKLAAMMKLQTMQRNFWAPLPTHLI
jgi:hypothetical protein